MTDEIEQLLRNLHLKKIAAIVDDELVHAEKHQLSYGAFLARLLRARPRHVAANSDAACRVSTKCPNSIAGLRPALLSC